MIIRTCYSSRPFCSLGVFFTPSWSHIHTRLILWNRSFVLPVSSMLRSFPPLAFLWFTCFLSYSLLSLHISSVSPSLPCCAFPCNGIRVNLDPSKRQGSNKSVSGCTLPQGSKTVSKFCVSRFFLVCLGCLVCHTGVCSHPWICSCIPLWNITCLHESVLLIWVQAWLHSEIHSVVGVKFQDQMIVNRLTLILHRNKYVLHALLTKSTSSFRVQTHHSACCCHCLLNAESCEICGLIMCSCFGGLTLTAWLTGSQMNLRESGDLRSQGQCHLLILYGITYNY